MIPLVQQYCKKILNSNQCSRLPFHNVIHTEEVVNNIKLIGEYLNLTRQQIEPVVIAGWFHDIGFSKIYKGHEDISIGLAEKFLAKENYELAKIEIVISCINATKMPQNPKNKYAEIISDADIFHIGTDDFFYRKLLLRREWEIEFERVYSDIEWHFLNLEFLQKHTFFTPYGKSILMKKKENNEEKVKRLISLY